MFNAKISVAGYFAVECPASAEVLESVGESAAAVAQASPAAVAVVFAACVEFHLRAAVQRYCHAA